MNRVKKRLSLFNMAWIFTFGILAFFCTVAYSQIEVELSVVQYDNPLGTSYTGNNNSSDRKCCDTGGSSCSTGNDTCDVYFLFCIGSQSDSSSSPGCNGSSIDMSDQVSRDSDVIRPSDYTSLRKFSTLTWWSPNSTSVLAKALDIDDPDNPSSTTVDLIDQFSRHLDFSPDTDYLSSKVHLIHFVLHVSLDVELRVWCARGWYGPLCQHGCHNDDFHACTQTGQQQLARKCQPDALVLRVSTPPSSPYGPLTLKGQLSQFLAVNVCPATASSVRVEMDAIQRYIANQTSVVFRGYCDNSTVSRLKFDQTLFVLSQLTTRLGTPSQQLGLSVIPPSPIPILESPDMLRIVFLMRLVGYKNNNIFSCSGTDPQCNPQFVICLKSISNVCEPITNINTRSLTDCGDKLVDVDKPNATKYHRPTWLMYLKRFPSLFNVTVSDFRSQQSILQQNFTLGKLQIGSDFLDSYPQTFAVNGTAQLTLEVMGWCLNCYYGDQCQYKNQTCQPNVNHIPSDCTKNSDCSGGGLCYNQTCVCQKGWLGRTCNVDMDECATGVCPEANTCTNTPGGYTCSCRPGFTGRNCDQDIDECISKPCHGGAVCLNTFGGFTCVCKNGTVANNCGYNFCTGNPCQNNGTCVARLDDHLCNCLSGWTGLNCEQDIDECTSSPCQNSGVCQNTNGSYHCDCVQGWLGQHCATDRNECLYEPCLNNGSCSNTLGSFTCACPVEWHGRHCQDDTDECSTGNACNGHGQCNNTRGGFVCECAAGWTGDQCDDDIDECQGTVLCQNGGRCINGNGTYSCACPGGWTGQHCESDFNECLGSNPCTNGGTCLNTNGSYSCVCPRTWTGQNCTYDFDECTMESSPCLHVATCINTMGSFDCMCTEHWTGTTCDQDVDECRKTGVCANGGTCTNTVGSFNCTCTPGWGGMTCTEDIDDCVHEGLCFYGSCSNTMGSYYCECIDGYTGPNCKDDIDECSLHNPCQNGATCTNMQGAYACDCTQGWHGRNCSDDVDECTASIPCQHGGTCANSPGSFSCSCTHGWTGHTCDADIDECLHNPCLHGGTCNNTAGSFSCACAPGWQGENCTKDIDECIGVACEHGGVCVDGINAFTCACAKGYTGVKCETEINECKTSTCKNNAQCVDHVGYYRCVCPLGYTGHFCEADIDECKGPSPCKSSERCTNTVGSYHCERAYILPPTVPTQPPTTTVPTSVDVFSLQFTQPIKQGQLLTVQKGIQKILRLLTCSDSSHIYVSLVQNSISTPNTVQFHAQCDGHHLTNTEINSAIRTLSTEKLAEIFPAELANTQQSPQKQSWMSSHTPLVAGVAGGIGAIVIVTIIVFVIKRKNKLKRMLPEEMNVLQEVSDMDGKTSLAVHNPVFNTLYTDQTQA